MGLKHVSKGLLNCSFKAPVEGIGQEGRQPVLEMSIPLGFCTNPNVWAKADNRCKYKLLCFSPFFLAWLTLKSL